MKQSARMFFAGNDHKDIFFNGNYHHKMYIGSKLVWEKLDTRQFRFSFLLTATRTPHADGLIDEMGIRLELNSGAIIKKCAICLKQEDGAWYTSYALIGKNISRAITVAYIGYQGEVVADGMDNLDSHLFYLKKGEETVGDYSYYYYGYVRQNMIDEDAAYMTDHMIGMKTENVRIFYDMDKRDEWLLAAD